MRELTAFYSIILNLSIIGTLRYMILTPDQPFFLESSDLTTLASINIKNVNTREAVNVCLFE